MMNVELYGIIGGKKLKPTKTTQWKRRNGKPTKVHFMRFTMFCEDMTKKAELDEMTNKYRRPRKPIQVILPENKRGEKLFEYLEPGRHVFVKGRLTNDPNVKGDNVYTNDKCYMADLTFLDSPRYKQMERAIRDQVSAGLIDEKTAEGYKAKMTEFYSGKMAELDEPRLYVDETLKAKPEEARLEDVDPDHYDAQPE